MQCAYILWKVRKLLRRIHRREERTKTAMKSCIYGLSARISGPADLSSRRSGTSPADLRFVVLDGALTVDDRPKEAVFDPIGKARLRLDLLDLIP